MFRLFGLQSCGILVHQPGIEQEPPALEGKVLTTRFPGKSQGLAFLSKILKLRSIHCFFTHNVIAHLIDYSKV